MKHPACWNTSLHCLLWLCLYCVSAPLLAATFTVTNTQDSGPGSLRQAMIEAMMSTGTHTIDFDSAPDGTPIVLESPLPPIPSNVTLTITGRGPTNTIIDGNNLHRPFSSAWTTNMHLTLRDLTIRNGRAEALNGGAIDLEGGSASSLTVERVEFIDNYARYEGGAIRTQVPTHIRNSVFVGNQSVTFGGAIAAGNTPLTVINSSFAGNTSVQGIIRLDSDIAPAINGRLVNVTITGNSTHFSTIYVTQNARLSISNSLIAGNARVDGGNLGFAAGGAIIAEASHNNIIGPSPDPGLVDGVNGNQLDVTDPLVGPLGNYGGTTRTVPLLPGSPAINAGTTAGGDIPNVDQRGISRVGTTDIGAFESRGFTLARMSGNNQSATVDTAFADALVVRVDANQAIEPVEGGRILFSAPTSGASAALAPPDASINASGQAQTTATANATSGGYNVNANASIGTTPASVDFSLTNEPAGDPACASFTFPYTLSGTDNAARVAELRQAIDCANANATDDVIDLDSHTLVFSDGPYVLGDDNALPPVSSSITLQNGALERDPTAPAFRLMLVEPSASLTLTAMQLRYGAATGDGGAILSHGMLMARDSVFEHNTAGARGGAIRTSVAGTLFAVMSRFSYNHALDGAALAYSAMSQLINVRFDHNGDANTDSVLWSEGYSAMIGVLLHDNQLTRSGSSLMVVRPGASVTEMRHATIADNSVEGVFLRMENSSNAQVRNSIVWNNQYTSLGAVTPVYSILPGVAEVNGNLDRDPGFVATPGNYRLAAGSPAIDAGDNTNSFFDMLDIDNDGDSAEMLPDLDLGQRPWDDPDAPDTGVPGAPPFDLAIVDMGAFERQAPVALPSLSINDVSVNEGDSGTTDAVFTISLSAPAPLGGVAFDIATADGTATVGDDDYVPLAITGMFIPDGQSSVTFTVQVNGDTQVETDETFLVNVTNVVNATVADGQGVGTILNDDVDPCAGFGFPYTLSGSNNSARVSELKQAIECANANSTHDTIDLGGHTVFLTNGPYLVNFGATALPDVASVITLQNGRLERDPAASEQFRFLSVGDTGELTVLDMAFVGADSRSSGGAIRSTGPLYVHRTLFEDNRTTTGGGGAVAALQLVVTRSVFRRNSAYTSGAAIWGGRQGPVGTLPVTILNSRFEDHGDTATPASPIVFLSTDRDIRVENLLFVRNTTERGLISSADEATVSNITFADNTLADEGILRGMVTAHNSIVWGNQLSGWGIGGSFHHSLVQGGFPAGTGNIDLDPRFTDPANGDYTLASGSPAIDAGDNGVVGLDTYDFDGDGDTTEALPDLAGNPRQQDDAGVVDTGSGSAPIVDMGAYERQADSAPAGITIQPTSGLVTNEAGGNASFTVVLDTQPHADVSIALSSSDTTEGTVAPASLSFTSANWNSPQTVTVTGVDDAVVDGDIAYTIVTAAAVSADVNYDGIDPDDVTVTNTDNDSAGITVTPTSGLVTTEGMGATGTPGMDQFSVVLTSQPVADVTIALSSSDTTEGTVSSAILTFTSANWNTAQQVDVLSVDDTIVDGDITYTIVTAPAVSADANYNGIDPADVSVTNIDNDSAGIMVNPTSGLLTTEAGGTASFTVALYTQPSAEVSIALSSSDTTEGTVAPASVIFTTANWNIAQTITVTGVDDSEVDGDIAYSIITAAAVSADAYYNGIDPADVQVTNTDDEIPGAAVFAYKSVHQVGTASQPVIYEIALSNVGDDDQPDDPASDELVDILPPQLALTLASATSGTVSFDLASNTVRWNGVLAAGAAPVLIQIEADVLITQPALISNQATVHYDSDGDGANDATRLSTDPALAGEAEPTVFQFAGTAPGNTPIMIPVNNKRGLLGLVLLMTLAAGGTLMRRRI